MRESDLFNELRHLATEQRNPASTSIDTASVAEILRIINTEDHRVPEAVAKELPYIEQAVHLIVGAFRRGGRLFYVGAGTSGRLGVLDASECPPTFGTDPRMVQGLIAGGPDAVFHAQEGAEDHEQNGVRSLQDAGVTPADIVCGIAASRRTPYVVGAVKYARAMGCSTLFLTCTPRSEFTLEVDVAICPVPGPEVIMGSTRMKSGSVQKMVLNMLTTASFVHMGKVYENMMVDLQMTNQKLRERSLRTIMTAAGIPYGEATHLLDLAEGHVKTALVMHFSSVDAAEARSRLTRASGFVRPAIAGEVFSPD